MESNMAREVPKAAVALPKLEKTLVEKMAVFVVVVGPLLATVYAIATLWQRYVNATDLSLLLVFYVLSGLGITVGHHRLLTHRSFETYPWVKALLLMFGAMAPEGPPGTWASIHLEHHAHSDTVDDPHSPLVNLWHSHVGWMFHHVPQPEIYGPWLAKDPVVVFVDRTWFVWAVAEPDHPLRHRRLARAVMRRVGAHLPHPPRHLERQLHLPHLRPAPVCHQRHEPQ